MIRTALVAPSVLALLLSASVSMAQAPAPAVPPASAPVTPAAPSGAPAPLAPGEGPVAPVSKTTQELLQKLDEMSKGGLTADEVATRAVKNSNQLIAKHKQLEAAEATVDQANAAFVPSLTVGARYTRLSSIESPNLGTLVAPVNQQPGPIAPTDQLVAVPLQFPILLNDYVLSAQLNVPLSDYVLRTARTVTAAKHSRAASELDERATRLSVARDARVAYYQWVRLRGVVYIGNQSVEQANGHLVDTNNGFQAGLVSKADVLRAQAGLKNAQLFQERAKSAADLASTRLSVLMKDESSAEYEVGENVLAPRASLPNTGSIDAAYREAAQNRLELKQLLEVEQSLRAQARVSSSANYPRLDAQAGAQYSNPNPRYFPAEDKFQGTWEASLMLSWTPTAIFGAQAGARTFDARAAEVAAQRQALIDALKLEVSEALRSEKDAEFGVVVSEQALVASEEGYRVRRELFRSGRATLVEVTDSETELTRARLELVNAHVDLRISQVALEHALGRDVAK